MATLIKVDKNGTKYWQGLVKCDRCGGEGYYIIGVNNGRPVLSPVDNGVCFKCGGRGKVEGSWKEYTPEHEAKLEAQRQKRAEKRAQEEAQRLAEEAEAKRLEEIEAEKREAAIRAEKAISQHVGEVGEKLELDATYLGTATFEVKSFAGFGTDTMHIHRFKDAAGNKLIWRTGSWSFEADEGDLVRVSGRVKAHGEYKDEKQTELTRCKVVKR